MFTLAVVAATACASMPTSASAGGYGGRSGSDYSLQRSHARAHAHEVGRRGNRHLAWCHSQFESYRESDNTFQPYGGPRRECVSPYDADRRSLFADRNHANPEDLSGDRFERGRDLARRDPFGNLPETIPGGDGVVDTGDRAPRDRFGNLPEQPQVGVGADTAVGQGRPSAEAAGASTPSTEPPVAANIAEPGTGAATAQDATDAPAADVESPAPGTETEPVEAAAAPDDVGSEAQKQDRAAGEE